MHRALHAILLAGLVVPAGGQSPPVLRATRDLRIDQVTANLTNVGVMLVSRSGEILLTQPEDHLIRFFSPTGVPGSFGREGEGPGEFRNNIRAGWLGDSLWVSDPQLSRVSIFAPDHKFVRSYPYPSTIRRDATDRGASAIDLYVEAVYHDGSLRVMPAFYRGTSRPAWAAGSDSSTTLLVRVAPSGLLMGRIALWPATTCTVSYRLGSTGVGTTGIPFCAMPVVPDREAGSLVARVTVEGAETGKPGYRVIVIGETGTPLFSRLHAYTPRAVSRAALDSAAARRREIEKMYSPQERAARPTVTPATTWPPIRRVVVGRDSTIWLEQDQATATHHWLILDPKGAPVGSMILPAEIRLQVAERGTLWGLETDADGLQGVVRYRLAAARP